MKSNNQSHAASYSSLHSLSLHDYHALFLPASTSPDEFTSSSPFDLLSIFSNRESASRYRGDKSSCLNNISYPQLAARTMRHIQSFFSSNVGMHPLSSACINYGMSHLASHSSISDLIKARYRFYSSPSFNTLPDLILSSLDTYLKSFNFDLPYPERINIFMPEDILTALHGISSMIGVKSHRLASLSILYSLTTQSSMNDSDRAEAIKYVSSFYDLAQIKTRAANSIMNEFGIPEVDDKRAQRTSINWKEIQ